jgi:hypothetical protein
MKSNGDYSLVQRRNFWLVIAFLLLLAGIFYPYVQTEILTSLYNKDLPIQKICTDNNPLGQLRYSKIIEYEKSSGQARVYCLYADSKQNTSLRLTQTKDWQVYLTLRLNKDRNFYWPMYI